MLRFGGVKQNFGADLVRGICTCLRQCWCCGVGLLLEDELNEKFTDWVIPNVSTPLFSSETHQPVSYCANSTVELGHSRPDTKMRMALVGSVAFKATLPPSHAASIPEPNGHLPYLRAKSPILAKPPTYSLLPFFSHSCVDLGTSATSISTSTAFPFPRPLLR
jgi:hypothetical protein